MKHQCYKASPSDTFFGNFLVAADKSISHRAIMLGSLAVGQTIICNFLQSEDALATLNAFKALGVDIYQDNDSVHIVGVGLYGLKPPKAPLNMGNSGTSMRLLAGILAAQRFNSCLVGDDSLSRRPMQRIATPLRLMGGVIDTNTLGSPPLHITGSPLQAITYTLPIASAQVKSCLLLAAMWAKGTTCLYEPMSTRDHTERLLQSFGYHIDIQKQQNQTCMALTGGGTLYGTTITVPNDLSSAAFLMVAAAIANNGQVVLPCVGINPTRTGIISLLKQMGADICLLHERMLGCEPVADIVVQSSQLKGIDIDPALVSLAIDEFPVLFIAASCAQGVTRLTGAKELRAKESDRLQVMAEGLARLGIDCHVFEDGIHIVGKGSGQVFGGGIIDCHHDHRIAMSFCVASLRASHDIVLRGTQTIATSFPGFDQIVQKAGIRLEVFYE